MATANSTAAHCKSNPMNVYRSWWGDSYDGTMQQLVETGKFKPEWFPGMPGNRPTSSLLKNVEFDGRIIPELYITRKDSSRRRFHVMASVDEHEQALRSYQDGYEQAHAKSLERATSWLRSMAKSKAEFIALNIYTIKRMMGLNIKSMESGDGFSLSSESVAKIYSGLDAMAEEMKCADIQFDADKHEESRRRLAADAFESQGLGRHIDNHKELGIDREAEKAKFVAEALTIPVEGYCSAAIKDNV